MNHPDITIRPGIPGDATTIAALAVQVFLDTYAANGVRPDLAEEAFAEYSATAFAARLAEPGRAFLLAERDRGLIAFAEFIGESIEAPVAALRGAELVRLYVQPAAQGAGLGRRLLHATERRVMNAACATLWLTAWEHNERAIAFYRRQGYAEVGLATYRFQDNVYGNRVFAKALDPNAEASISRS